MYRSESTDVNFDVAARDFKYYIFDWDDNILHMPTKIHLEQRDENGTWRPVEVSTSVFALVRNDFRYRLPPGGRAEAFKEFQDVVDESGDVSFIRDTKAALARVKAGEKPGPSFETLRKTLVEGRIFAIVTARGHAPDTLREAVRIFIDTVLTPAEHDAMMRALRGYRWWLDKKTEFGTDDEELDYYLSMCRYHAVTNPVFFEQLKNDDDFGGRYAEASSAERPELAKEFAIRDFVEHVFHILQRTGGLDVPVSVGFSDDDAGNVRAVSDYIRAELAKRFEKFKFVVYDTSDPSLENGRKVTVSGRNSGGRTPAGKALSLLFALFSSVTAFGYFNVGPLLEHDGARDFTAVRPFWSTTPKTEDFVWPLGTWHTDDDHFWYRFLFLAYGHEGSFNLFPFWFSESERETGRFSWAAFPFYGSHPHMLFMDDIHFALWPIYMDYSVKDVRSHAVLWPIFSWKDSPRQAIGVWPLWGWSRLRESTHFYMIWPVITHAEYLEDRDTSGRGESWMIWPLAGEVARERERQRLFLPPFFSWAETPQTWRLRCPWPLVDIERGPARDRWSVWPVVEHSVQKRYADGGADDVIWRFGWQLVEKTRNRLNIFPFFTKERGFLRVWPFWSRMETEGRETVKVLDIIPVRHADGIARNLEPFWSLYSSEDLPDGRCRRKFLFNLFWWTFERLKD